MLISDTSYCVFTKTQITQSHLTFQEHFSPNIFHYSASGLDRGQKQKQRDFKNMHFYFQVSEICPWKIIIETSVKLYENEHVNMLNKEGIRIL